MASRRKAKRTQIPSVLTNKPVIYTFAILFVALIIYVFIQNTNNTNYKNIKQNKNEYLVYTKYSDHNTQYTKDVPYVNLKAEVFKEVNKDILTFSNKYMEAEKGVITYDYAVNGTILSVVLKAINNESVYAPEPYFRTYNINLEKEEVIADEALLEFFGVTKLSVTRKIERQFQKYYSEIVRQGYYTSNECSYECFLKWRGVNNYLDNVSFYVKDGKLVAYKTFVAHSMFGEEEYFDDNSFEFLIAEKPITTE
jgi:hypothetical protein